MLCVLAEEETLFIHLIIYHFLVDKEGISGHNLDNLILGQ